MRLNTELLVFFLGMPNAITSIVRSIKNDLTGEVTMANLIENLESFLEKELESAIQQHNEEKVSECVVLLFEITEYKYNLRSGNKNENTQNK